jgi:hypothetical protein
MFLSKIWFVLVGLTAGVAMGAAFVAPRAADRRILGLEGERLDRAQYAAEQMLKADAHSWIDYASKLSRDANLAESLDAASKGAGEPRLVSETVRGRLKALVPDPAAIGLVTVGAIDLKGRVVARLGEREGQHGESLAGIEVLADALRGYLSDDVWGAGGKLQRVAAVPVLSRTRDRIVGALWVGAETGKRLAEVWKQNLGVDIGILLRGQVVSATVPESYLSMLPARIEEHRKEILDSKRTQPIPFTVGSEKRLAVAAPFVGQAGEQGGLFVLIGTVRAASSPLGLLSQTSSDDLRWGNFPWLGLTFALIVILGVGLALQRWETERPLARLREEAQKLARGELHKLDDAAHPGKFGGIARDVNAAMERFTHAPAPRSENARKDVGAILGPPLPPPPANPASVFDLPSRSTFDSPGSGPPFGAVLRPSTPPPAFMGPGVQEAPPSLVGPGPSLVMPPPPPADSRPAPPSPGNFWGAPPTGEPSPPRGYGGPPTVSAAAQLGATPERRLSSPQMSPGPPGTRPLTPAGPPPMPPDVQDAIPTGILGNNPLTSPGGLGYDHQVTAIGGQVPDLRAGGVTAVASGAALTEEEPAEPADESAPQANGGGGDALDDRAYAAHIREVFDAYVATRRRCGETVATLTLDKFQARLETNRQQLVAKYGCRSARFSVYVKDGKAAVKATPLR